MLSRWLVAILFPMWIGKLILSSMLTLLLLKIVSYIQLIAKLVSQALIWRLAYFSIEQSLESPVFYKKTFDFDISRLVTTLSKIFQRKQVLPLEIYTQSKIRTQDTGIQFELSKRSKVTLIRLTMTDRFCMSWIKTQNFRLVTVDVQRLFAFLFEVLSISIFNHLKSSTSIWKRDHRLETHPVCQQAFTTWTSQFEVHIL